MRNAGSHLRGGLNTHSNTPSGAATNPNAVSFAPMAAAQRIPTTMLRRAGPSDVSTTASSPAASMSVTVISLYASDPTTTTHGVPSEMTAAGAPELGPHNRTAIRPIITAASVAIPTCSNWHAYTDLIPSPVRMARW